MSKVSIQKARITFAILSHVMGFILAIIAYQSFLDWLKHISPDLEMSVRIGAGSFGFMLLSYLFYPFKNEVMK